MPEFFEDKNRDSVDWSAIQSYRQQKTVAGLSMALAESHKLLDHIMSKQGYRGDKMIDKIQAARTRFTELNILVDSLETYQKVFLEYDQEISTRSIEKAISGYERAIFDLSSETDFQSPSIFGRAKAWVDVNLIAKPANSQRYLIYFLLFITFILILDNNHLGQQFVHWLAGILGGILIWVVGIVTVVVFLLLVLSAIVSFMEQRK